MTKQRNSHFYLRSPQDNDVDDNDDDNNHDDHNDEEDDQPPSPPSTSPPSEASDSGIDTLPQKKTSSVSSGSNLSNTPEGTSASAGAAAALTSPETRNGRELSIEDPTPQEGEQEEEDADTSTWVARNRRQRRRLAASESYERAPGSFSDEVQIQVQPTPTPVAPTTTNNNNHVSRKSSQDVVVEINPVGEGLDSSERSPEELFPRPPQRARKSREGTHVFPRSEPTPRVRRFSRENSHDVHCGPEPDRLSPRSKNCPGIADEAFNGDFVFDITPRTRKTSGGILKNVPDRESVELQDFNQPTPRARKHSREPLAVSTPVETIQEDISEAEPTTSPAPSLFRNRKVSQEYLQAGGGVAGDDPDVEEIIEGPGLTLSDEEFQENYLGNIPANKRKYGVFPHQYRTITTPAASTPVGVHPPTAARRYRRSVSETGGKRISFDFTNQGFTNDDDEDGNVSISDNYPKKSNGLSTAQSAPDLRLSERYKRARRYSQSSLDTLASKASSNGSDVSLSKTVAAHVRRDSIALFSDKLNSNSLKRRSQKLVADLEHLRKSHVGITGWL